MTAPLVYITGASSGIGQALALQFYARGYRLALVARRAEVVTEWARAQALQDDRWAAFAADVRDVVAIVATGQRCLREHGVPDVVVANAGVSVGMDSAVIEDLEVMRATLGTNLLGLAATFSPFIAAMRERGSGRLVGVASVAGIRGLPGHGAYCASKSGVIAYCESLRGDLRASGVRVVTLVPGYVDTPLTQKNPYGMPFLMPVQRFAQQAYRAIESGASYRVFPWQMGILAKVLRLLPNALDDRLLQGRARKPRQARPPVQ